MFQTYSESLTIKLKFTNTKNKIQDAFIKNFLIFTYVIYR